VVILILFLFECGAAVISIVAIPLSSSQRPRADARGAPINTMTLAGFGIAVGGGRRCISDVENVVRDWRLNRSQASTRRCGVILEASSSPQRHIYATLIDVVACAGVPHEGLSAPSSSPCALRTLWPSCLAGRG